MSYLVAAPEFLASTATDLATIGSSVTAANAAAAAPTTGVLAAGADDVSTAIASLMSVHGQQFQAVSRLAAVFHSDFVQALSAGGNAYQIAEATGASLLDTVANFPAGPGGISPPYTRIAAYAAQAATNYGYGNVGNGNVGLFNTGLYNFGIGNNGSVNLGIGNISPNFAVDPGNITTFGGFGLFNNGIENVGAWNTGFENVGLGNAGTLNLGIANSGTGNSGLPLSFASAFGVGNHGNYNRGLFNYGNYNTGILLTGNHLIGIGPLAIAQ